MTMLALVLAATAAAQATPASALEAELHARYPEVVRWEIEALDQARAKRAEAETGAVTVVLLGARSAVAVGDAPTVWFAVRGFRTVLVADRHLAARSDAAVEHFALEERDVLAVGCTPLADSDAVAGSWTRRNLRAGDVVCDDALEPKPPVVRGANVAVVYSGPRIRIVATARAARDARLGERVQVSNPATGATYFAVATGDNEVTAHD
jgi:flagella basal body P-ring formation protein FlgA